MAAAFTQRYCEDSAQGRLQFTFYCDICQSAYAAPAEQAPNKRGLLRDRRLKRAYRDAFDRAQQRAKEHFNRCVQCKRWVCDADFSPDYGFCAECDRENEDK